jgi:agmatinase
MKPRFNYGALPEEYSKPENAMIVIIPVAYDGTSTWCRGADKGPEAVIEASAHMELYDIETDSETYKKGVFTDDVIEGAASVEEIIEAVSDTVQYHLEKARFPVVVGGEHTVSIGAIKTHAEQHNNLTVLQLDAHADLRDEYNGSRYNHACVMARARELCSIVQVGIRSMDSSEKGSVKQGDIFFAKDIYNKTEWVEKVISKLSQKVYVTIDLDVFDPSIMPSTGTPEPGGLLWYDVLSALKAICNQKDVVGFDVVELCPDSRNKAPDFLAAKLIYKLLSYKFGDSNGKTRLP